MTRYPMVMDVAARRMRTLAALWMCGGATALLAGDAQPAPGALTEARLLTEARQRIEHVRKSDATLEVVDITGRPVPGVRVTATQTDSTFLFSANVTILTGAVGNTIPLQHYRHQPFFTHQDQVARYKQRFLELFNAATVPFYWAMTGATPGPPEHAPQEAVVAWCATSGITVIGHPLVWTNRDHQPDWFRLQDPAGQRVALERHVRDTVTRFRGRVQVWDVVNEAAWSRRTLAGMREADYVSQPFLWARESDPDAALRINDAHAFIPNPRMDHALAIAATLASNNVPLDVVGVQAHIHHTSRFRLETLLHVLGRYRAIGKPIHITEFTPGSDGKPITDSWKSGAWDEQEQADYAVIFYTACFSIPEVESIGWWDVTDYSSWQPGGGVLRHDLSPKPVFHALRKLIHDTWRTHIDATTGPGGTVHFRGFHGNYDVRIHAPSGRQRHTRLTLAAGEATTLRMVLD